jgi:hypothetical protein
MADEVKPLPSPLSGKASIIIGTISGLAMAAAAFVPAPWNTLVGLIGFVGCVLAGVAVRPPAVVAGKPILQGTALAIGTTVLGLATQVYPLIPVGWPQGLALGVMGILGWLTGVAQPTPLKGAAPGEQLSLGLKDGSSDSVIDTKEKALDVMRDGKGPPAA